MTIKPCGKLLVILFSLNILALAIYSNVLATDISLNTTAHVYFSPEDSCTEVIVKELIKAKTEILVQAYSFTSKSIAKALVDAHKRGVRTVIVLDKSNQSKKYDAADFTARSGIPTFIDAQHAKAHNKIVIIDQETVITGSFNFKEEAKKKVADNLLILKSKDLAKVYIDNWNNHKSHSQKYEER
jgi:phosphatidylserine/phosphatidylglycerophosphate/cardiolipin synthase-like enzyme